MVAIDQKTTRCEVERVVNLAARAMEREVQNSAAVDVMALLEELMLCSRWLHRVNADTAALRMRLRWEIALARLAHSPPPEQGRRREVVQTAEQIVVKIVRVIEQTIETSIAGKPDAILSVVEELRQLAAELQNYSQKLRELLPGD